MAFAFSSISHAITSPASVSAQVCAIEPARGTGLDAPSWPKVLQCTGRPNFIASAITSTASSASRSGGVI